MIGIIYARKEEYSTIKKLVTINQRDIHICFISKLVDIIMYVIPNIGYLKIIQLSISCIIGGRIALAMGKA